MRLLIGVAALSVVLTCCALRPGHGLRVGQEARPREPIEFSFDGQPVPYHSHIYSVTCVRVRNHSTAATYGMPARPVENGG